MSKEKKKNNHVNRTLAIIIIASFCLIILAFGMSHPRKREIPVLEDGGSIFMSYEGPIFPLTSREAMPSIEAVREIEFDFDTALTAYNPAAQCMIRDRYTLINTSSEDQTILVIYPYVSSFYENIMPIFKVNDHTAETMSYSGMINSPANLNEISSWQGYAELLADSAYMEAAFTDYPTLDDSVIVYVLNEISDGGSDAPAPTMNIEFTMDYDQTMVFTYGFNGGVYDSEHSRGERSFFIPSKEDYDYNENRFLIVMGDDLDNFTLQGYQNGGCKAGEEIDEAKAHVDRIETTLGEILKTIANDYYEEAIKDTDAEALKSHLSADRFYGELCRLFNQYNRGEPDMVNHYQSGMLEDMLIDVMHYKRIFYETFELVIPSYSSVDVSAEFIKYGDFDYHSTGTKNEGVKGYDFVTQLGSILSFQKQSVLVNHGQNVEIVRENLDIDANQNHAELDLNVEHYYLEVRSTDK